MIKLVEMYDRPRKADHAAEDWIFSTTSTSYTNPTTGIIKRKARTSGGKGEKVAEHHISIADNPVTAR